MNEPWCTAFLGYAAGVFAPGRREPAAALDAAHHLLLGHALAAAAVHDQLPGAQVGIVLNLTSVRCEPDGDPRAADVVDALQNRLWLDALAEGRYPAVLPAPGAVREGDLEQVRGSADWLGVNYYTPFRIGAPVGAVDAVGQDTDAFPGAPAFTFRPRPPLTTMGWEVDATGLAETLRVTENGAAFADRQGARDDDRIAYLQTHLDAVYAAVEDGVPVQDYFAWSLLDNFEWAQGWTQRFGLVSVEPQTLQRVPKASYRWYAEHIAART
jgi:beta-glucosidase